MLTWNADILVRILGPQASQPAYKKIKEDADKDVRVPKVQEEADKDVRVSRAGWETCVPRTDRDVRDQEQAGMPAFQRR